MDKRHLIFLHGALGCKEHWDRFLPVFENSYIVHPINFPFHGNSEETLKDFSYQSITGWLKAYIKQNNISEFSIIGYSMGGYIGLNLISENIEGYKSLITLATKLKWSKAIAEEEREKLTKENLLPIKDKLNIEHGNKWEKLIDFTRETLLSLGENPIEKNRFIHNKIPITMLSGSKDKMVSQEEIKVFRENNPSINSILLENQPHSIERMETGIIADTLFRLLNQGNELSF